MTDLRALPTQIAEVIAQISRLVDGAGEWIHITPELLRDWASRLAEKAPEPVAWREHELAYVVEECKRIRVLGLNEMREALTDIAAWAANRLSIVPPPASPEPTQELLDAAFERIKPTLATMPNAPKQASPDDARDAARWRALRNWPYAMTRLVHGTDWPEWGPGTKFPEAGDVIDAWIDGYMADNQRAAIAREGGANG